MYGINPDYDYLADRQQDKPYCFCSCCGREIYRPFTETCDWCLFDVEVEEETE